MYSESEDFKEKQDAYAHMSAALNQFCSEEIIKNSRMALEIGGSGGLLAGMVSNAGPRVICTDIIDVQVKYNGEFPRRLKEKFERNGFELDLGKIEFHTADAQDLLYGNEKFDLVFSLNAFEHIPDPIKAINEIARVLRKDGVFYASFDPVWTADSGSHFMHYVKEPWLHLLLNDGEFRERMRQVGAAEWEINEYPIAMNRRPAGFYKTEVRKVLEALFSKSSVCEWSGCISPDDLNHVNRSTAAERHGWEPEDLLIRGFQIVAVK